MVRARKDKLFSVIENQTLDRALFEFSDKEAGNALRFHHSIPTYRETELLSLYETAAKYEVDSIFVKDESSRFGLKAFKGLGGSYCMFRILCELFGFDPLTADYRTFADEHVRAKCSKIEFVTATDGNHGKGVSWAAKLFGCRARVYMPKGSVEARRQAIEDAGAARAKITDLNYDQTVQFAAELAQKNGWILIQDTAWDGYEQYPNWIIEGYLTLAAEAAEQMKDKVPTHVFLQAGVGAMAGGLEAYLLNRYWESKPNLILVEPSAAACIYQSVCTGDGKAHSLGGDPVTMMAGLNCGTPCKTVWPILRDYSNYFCSCEEKLSEQGMRAYGKAEGREPKIVSGESGAVTYGLLLHILKSNSHRRFFKIDEDSVILLINTEGDTDPEGYRRVMQD